jgi:hypothetical protein
MDIFKVYFANQWKLIFEINPILIILLVIIILLYIFLVKNNLSLKEYEIDEAIFGIGNSNIKIKPNYEEMQIAYQLFVELSTRKIGLPIDFENDFIIEIYDSWFEFFKITREHIKSIPAQKIRKSKTTRAILNIAIEILNEGLRPHLTKWQAKFRKNYEIFSMDENYKHKTPQELQREFPDYEILVTDMKEINKKLIEYRKKMKEISIGD